MDLSTSSSDGSDDISQSFEHLLVLSEDEINLQQQQQQQRQSQSQEPSTSTSSGSQNLEDTVENNDEELDETIDSNSKPEVPRKLIVSQVITKVYFTSTSIKWNDTPVADNDDDSIPKCCICLLNAPKAAYIPCGHRCICGECKNRAEINLVKNHSVHFRAQLCCPICREHSYDIVVIHDI